MINDSKINKWLSYASENNFRALLVFVILVTLTYIQAIQFNFTDLDDLRLIGPPELKLSNVGVFFSNGVFYFTNKRDIYYRPIQNLMYATIKQFSHKNAFGYHLVNIVLHIAACWLLFIFLQGIIKSKEIALLLAAIFAVHPILAQAVAWIPGIVELLVAVFLLSGFLLLRSFIMTATIKPFLGVAIGVCLLLALLTKESAIAFIPLAFVYSIFFTENREKFTIKICFISGVFALATIVWWYLRSRAVGEYAPIGLPNVVVLLSKNSWILIPYIGNIFIPLSLSPFPNLTDLNAIPGLLAIVALIGAGLVIKGNRNKKLIIFGILWFLLFLVPTLYAHKEDAKIVPFNHRLYLPFIGVLIIISEVFLLSQLGRIKAYAAVALLAIFTIISIVNLSVFKNKYNFYKTAIVNSPHTLWAYEKLGNIYLVEQKCDEALEIYKSFVKVALDLHTSYWLIGNTYLNCYGDANNALIWYEKAMKVHSRSPSVANTCISLGNIYYQTLKDNNKAEYWYKEALKRDSTALLPMEMLGAIYLVSGRYNSAEYWFSKLLRHNPSSVSYNGMGIIEYNRRNYSNAAKFFIKSFELKQTETGLLLNLAFCYMEMNDFTNALRYANQYAATGKPLPAQLQQYLNGKKK